MGRFPWSFGSILAATGLMCTVSLVAAGKDKTSRAGAASSAVAALKAGGKTFQARFSLTPVEEGRTDASPGLRSLTLYADPGLRLEPPGTWPNGRPVSAEVFIGDDEARRLIDKLAKYGFFKTAGKHHSVRTQSDPVKYPPPADSREYAPVPRKDRHCRLTLIVSDERWHTYYEGDWDWGPAMFSRLEDLRKLLKGDAAKAVDQLVAAAREKH